MKIKYLILDFGKVLAAPTTGHWFITPKFIELIDMNEVSVDKFNESSKKYSHILNRQALTEVDEYKLFYDFYDSILKDINYSKYDKSIVEALAFNMTYESTKYTKYDNVNDELEKLSKEYTLIMLTDNWPCVNRILNEYDITKYFDRVYISSVYNCQKSDKVFFDYVINDYDIKEGEAIFIDDNELLLDIAREKDLDTRLMVRIRDDVKSKHKVIHNLYSI